jgi:hypothetical protein
MSQSDGHISFRRGSGGTIQPSSEKINLGRSLLFLQGPVYTFRIRGPTKCTQDPARKVKSCRAIHRPGNYICRQASGKFSVRRHGWLPTTSSSLRTGGDCIAFLPGIHSNSIDFFILAMYHVSEYDDDRRFEKGYHDNFPCFSCTRSSSQEELWPLLSLRNSKAQNKILSFYPNGCTNSVHRTGNGGSGKINLGRSLLFSQGPGYTW